jgi:transposase-like protein
MSYSTDRKAKILVESSLTTDQDTARRHDVSRRSIIRWRKALDTDMALQRAVAMRWQEFREADTWADDATHSIRKAQAFIRDACEQMDPSDPEALDAVTRALSTLVDATQMARIIDARLADQNSQHRASADKDAPRYLRRAN